MSNAVILEKIVSGEQSPETLPETYRREVGGFRGDPNRMDAFRALQEVDPFRAYRAVVQWVTQIGEQIRDGTAHPHWTTCTDTLKTLSEYIAADQSSYSESLSRVIPALEAIVKQRTVEESDHYNYQSIAMNLLFKMAKESTYAAEARESLKNIRDSENVSLVKRAHARNALAHYEGFEQFWNTHDNEVYNKMLRWAGDIQVFGKYMPEYVHVADFFKRIGEEDVQHLCLVAGITAYNEKEISQPINLKEGEDMVNLPAFELSHKAWSIAHAGVNLIGREIESGEVYNHAWEASARISNTSPAELQRRYSAIIQKMRE